jgi:hypothetical protein
MTATVWILVAVGVWLVAMGTMGIIAAATKEVDRAQSALVAGVRRDRFVAPRRRARVVDARPAARRRASYPRSYVGG